MKNWRTTLFGCLAAAIPAAQGAAQLNADNRAGWLNVAFAALIGAFSYFAKDSAVTGTGA